MSLQIQSDILYILYFSISDVEPFLWKCWEQTMIVIIIIILLLLLLLLLLFWAFTLITFTIIIIINSNPTPIKKTSKCKTTLVI